MEQSIRLLEERIESFLAEQGAVISASRVIDPLLEIWGLASEVNPAVSAPVEKLLTALVGRELTTLDELVTVMDEVRVALATSVLPTGV